MNKIIIENHYRKTLYYVPMKPEEGKARKSKMITKIYGIMYYSISGLLLIGGF